MQDIESTTSYLDSDDRRALIVKANKERDTIALSIFMLEECPKICQCGKGLYIYNGKHYVSMVAEDVRRLFHSFLLKYGITTGWNRRNDVIDSVFSWNKTVKVEEMNNYPDLLCFNNGILNLITKEFIPHSDTYYFDSAVEVDYDPNAKDCSVFLKFLQQVFNNNETLIQNSIMLGGYLISTSTEASKMFLFDGPAACLDKDTFIQYNINDYNGNRINHKGGTIEMLYERFHNKPTPRGKGGYHLRSNKDLQFTVASINEHNLVFQNTVVDVVKSGVKKCYKLTTTQGKEIIATCDHKFFNGSKYKALKSLSVGDIVYIHNNTHNKNTNKPSRVHYREVMVKYHPSNHIKIINSCTYYRLKRCRAVIEADMNGMDYNKYINLLNTGDKALINNLLILNPIYHVHHINENKLDDRLDNLLTISSGDHTKLHMKDNHKKMRYLVIPDTIKSIKLVGERETYDIKCLYPYNNFIADGIVVHNSGKSTLLNTYSMFFHHSMNIENNQLTSLSLETIAGGGFKKEALIVSRVNLCAESKKDLLPAEEIKRIITGDFIEVDRKFRTPVTFRPKVKLVVACNGGIRFNDNSDGMPRRLQMFKFKNIYKEPEEYSMVKDPEKRHIYIQDDKLKNKIKEEKSAILNLFVEGLKMLRERDYHFIYTPDLDNEMKEFRRDSDTIREFLEDNYEIDMDAEIPICEVYDHYKIWYRNNVQDGGSIKLRAAEMGKRIREVFSVESQGQRTIKVKDNRNGVVVEEIQHLHVYPIKRIYIEPIDPEFGDLATAVEPKQPGLSL